MPNMAFPANALADDGLISPKRLAELLRISSAELAVLLGQSPILINDPAVAKSPGVQARLMEMIEILDRVLAWAGSPQQALAWYETQSLLSLGDQTAEALVKAGRAEALKRHLDRIALGGYT